ncbi:type I restriction enzyme endonuclease domain-containing protein [Methanothrix sp.]|uniref:type I restriction enzyme endonuclease domain-containing protein n=1 Tax=Methanothrix sp. TaxID=90426 RepID=UPI0033904712
MTLFCVFQVFFFGSLPLSNATAQIRAKVKHILRRHGYPADRQDEATLTVLEQAEAVAAEWASRAPHSDFNPSS